MDDNYVARRKSATHGEHLHHGVDYNVGRYAPKQSLGKVIVNVEEKEKVNLGSTVHQSHTVALSHHHYIAY